MPNLISKILCTHALLFSTCSLFAQSPQIHTVSEHTPQASVASALYASPYSFDFQNIEIDRVAQLIESIQPMDIVFAPKINTELTSPILLKESRLLEILQMALKPHQLQIKTLDRDLFWIDQAKNTSQSITFARHQLALPLMPIELCTKKTSLMLKQLNATQIQTEANNLLADFGKKDRIRAQLNQQQVQIYCMRQFDDVSARIIVIGKQQQNVQDTLNILIQGYQE